MRYSKRPDGSSRSRGAIRGLPPARIRQLLIEDRVKEIARSVYEPPVRGGLAGVLRHPLSVVLLQFLLTSVIGATGAALYAAHSKAAEVDAATKSLLIEQLSSTSQLAYARLQLSGMLINSIRHGEVEEAIHRKELYDEAFLAWNTSIWDTMFVLRVAQPHRTPRLDKELTDYAIPRLMIVDACVTDAYHELVGSCNPEAAVDTLLDCGLLIRLPDGAVAGNPRGPYARARECTHAILSAAATEAASVAYGIAEDSAGANIGEDTLVENCEIEVEVESDGAGWCHP